MLREILPLLATALFWVAVLRIAAPLIFGTLGALLCERSGVLNLGIEGIMVAGAFTGWLAVYHGAGLWVGVLAAAATGAVCGALHAFFTVGLALSQPIAGLGLTMLATSLSDFAYRLNFPKGLASPAIHPFAELAWLRIPILSGETPLTLAALAAVPAVGHLLGRMPAGLALRAAGENPAAVESQGLSVAAVRTAALMAGSALMAVGGACLTLSQFNAFFFNPVNGRGWICLALVVFGSWRPSRALGGALLFATGEALQLSLQQTGGERVPRQVFLMLPYALSIVALILASRSAARPRALMSHRPGGRGPATRSDSPG